MKLKMVLLFLMIAFKYTTLAQAKADDIVRIWLTAGKEPAKIQVYKSGQKYYGKILSLKNPLKNGKPKMDENNPDKSKRNQQIIGLVILADFEFDDDEWDAGKIYDPESGKTYSCFLTLKDRSTLKVRGYIGVSLLGRTEIWTKTSL